MTERKGSFCFNLEVHNWQVDFFLSFSFFLPPPPAEVNEFVIM